MRWENSHSAAGGMAKGISKGIAEGWAVAVDVDVAVNSCERLQCPYP